MSVTKLANGRYRAQVYDPKTGKTVSAAKVLGLEVASFSSKSKARDAVSDARKVLNDATGKTITVKEWRDRWTSDPLFVPPKEGTRKHYLERTKAFSEKHGDLPLDQVTDMIVAQWIAGGRNLSTVAPLKTMFNAAGSAKAGRLITGNPFANLGISKGKGRAEQDPPSEADVWAMLGYAWKLTHRGFAGWLQVAAWSGMRPGELDALRWSAVDLEASRIHVLEQWSAKEGNFGLPKNGKTRTILLTPQAREGLIRLPRTSEFCFTNVRGGHWTPSSRSHHWDRVRTKMDWLEKESRKALYLCTRHFCGWYLYNVLELPAEDVAIQLGHEDGGELVRMLYGHRDRKMALDRIAKAVDRQSNVRPLRLASAQSAHTEGSDDAV
jgi:integrase